MNIDKFALLMVLSTIIQVLEPNPLEICVWAVKLDNFDSIMGKIRGNFKSQTNRLEFLVFNLHKSNVGGRTRTNVALDTIVIN